MLIQKPAAGARTKGTPAAEDKVFAMQLPATLEFLTATAWDDGSTRKPGTIMIVAEGGRWRAWVHDQDGRRSAWVSALDLTNLGLEIEEGLLKDEMGWRPDRK